MRLHFVAGALFVPLAATPAFAQEATIPETSVQYGPVDEHAAVRADGTGEAADPAPLGPGSEMLDAAIAEAATKYPSVLAARAGVRAAQANAKGAGWQRFPSLSVEAQGIGTGSGSSDYSFRLEEPLWAGGRISGSIKVAKAQLDAATAGFDEVRLDISLRVSAAFYDVQRLAQREVILEDSLAEHTKLVDSMARRVDMGLSAASDLDLARSRAAQVEQDLVLTNGQRRVSLTRLRELTGDPSFSITQIVSYDPELHHPDAAGILNDALAFDPKRRRLQAERDVADADISVRRGLLMPQVNLQYQKPLYGPDSLGVVLRAQTDGGLSRFSAVDAAKQRLAQSEAAILSNERELREVIEADTLENSVARNRIATSAIASSSSQAVTDSYMRQFIAGRRTWLDVMNAVRESMAARLSDVEARTSAVASATRLLMRSGRWRPQIRQEDDQ